MSQQPTNQLVETPEPEDLTAVTFPSIVEKAMTDISHSSGPHHIDKNVRHKSHYINSKNKVGEHNHISGFLTAEQGAMNDLVTQLDSLSNSLLQDSTKHSLMLQELRDAICRHADF